MLTQRFYPSRLNFCKLDSAAGLIRFRLRNIACPSFQHLVKDVFNPLQKKGGFMGYIINQLPQWAKISEVLQQIKKKQKNAKFVVVLDVLFRTVLNGSKEIFIFKNGVL